jgi:hypothetical protein
VARTKPGRERRPVLININIRLYLLNKNIHQISVGWVRS